MSNITLKLVDPVSKIESDINKAIAETLNKKIKQNYYEASEQVKRLVASAVISQPEIESLVSGYLRGAFGIPIGVNPIEGLEESISNSISVSLKKFDNRLNGGLEIYIQPTSFRNILNLPNSSIVYEKGEINWMDWLLLRGDAAIIVGYQYTPKYGIGRSRMGYMEGGRFFRVPPEFSGYAENNFITRALEEESFLSSLETTLKGILA